MVLLSYCHFLLSCVYPLSGYMLVSQAMSKSQETKRRIQKSVISITNAHLYTDMTAPLPSFYIKKYFRDLLRCISSPVLSCVNDAEILWDKICFSDPVQPQRTKKTKQNKNCVEFHMWHLSSLLLHSFNCSPSFQVDEEQRKVDNVRWHTDHAEIPQHKGKNRCEIERAGHRHPGRQHQKQCSFFGQRQSCNEDKQKESSS